MAWRSVLRRPSWWQTTQWHQHRDQSEWTEAWDSRKLQVPRFSYNWWGFQARETLQDSTGNSSIDKVETTLERQEYFFQFQDTTDALPCHIHLPVYLWITNPHSRAPKENTSHGKTDRGRGGKTTSGNSQAWSSPSRRGQWRTGEMEETGCKIIRGAPTTLVVKGQMMMMIP